jgi:hypothetical protein
LARSVRLGNIADCTSAQGFFHDVPGAIFTKEKDFRLRGVLSDSASGLNSIQRRKPDVKHDQVRFQFFRFADRFESIRGLADGL